MCFVSLMKGPWLHPIQPDIWLEPKAVHIHTWLRFKLKYTSAAHQHAFSKNAKQKFRREHSQFRYSPPPRLHVSSSENLNQNWVIPRNRPNTGSPQARNITEAQYNSHSALSQIQTGAHLEDLPEYQYVTYPQEQLQLQKERFRQKQKLQNGHLFEYHIPPT